VGDIVRTGIWVGGAGLAVGDIVRTGIWVGGAGLAVGDIVRTGIWVGGVGLTVGDAVGAGFLLDGGGGNEGSPAGSEGLGTRWRLRSSAAATDVTASNASKRIRWSCMIVAVGEVVEVWCEVLRGVQIW
jgi:hypothetical protein